jgi:hypothetical protein
VSYERTKGYQWMCPVKYEPRSSMSGNTRLQSRLDPLQGLLTRCDWLPQLGGRVSIAGIRSSQLQSPRTKYISTCSHLTHSPPFDIKLQAVQLPQADIYASVKNCLTNSSDTLHRSIELTPPKICQRTRVDAMSTPSAA